MTVHGLVEQCGFVRCYRLALLCALALGVVACWKREPNWCPEEPMFHNCLNLSDGPRICTSSSECAPLVCDMADSKTCVECTATEDDACTGMKPVCGADNMCRACIAHVECDSEVCLPDGSCAASDLVAYVEPAPVGTDSSNCTLELPCATIGKGLNTGRLYVKLTGTLYEQVTLTNRDVMFLSDPGTRLTSTNTGPLLRVEGTSQVSIYDLEISGASGKPSGFGILATSATPTSVSLTRVKLSGNEGGGIHALGGTLTVSQSTILGNGERGILLDSGTLAVSRSTISGNAGGGIWFSNGAFVIVGNVFYNNGSDTSLAGGIWIGAGQAGASRLEFNSFHSNRAQSSIAAGIECTAGTFTALNNIVSENGTPTNSAQIGGSCMHAYSIMRPGTLPPGPGNLAMDPLFQNITTGDLHLRPESPARRAADPSTVLTGIAERDIDGDIRIAPATIGADELH